MTFNKKNSVKLKVAESIQQDINKGIVRVDSKTMDLLNLNPRGDYIEIEGKRMTVSLVGIGYDEDEGLGIIRMDGTTRRNAETGIGEIVHVKKANLLEAKRVVLAPIQSNITISGAEEMFKKSFLRRSGIVGDIIVSGGSVRNDSSESDDFEDLFSIFGRGFFEQNIFGIPEVKFKIVSTNPSGPILITENTELEIKSKVEDVRDVQMTDVNYEDIGGLEDEIKKIREMVELPLKHPEIFEKIGIEAPKGVLLYGAPGTGKTLLAKAVATETQANFIVVNGPEIMNKYYGESEKGLRDIFIEAEKNAPSIIFLDEIDAIAPKREDVTGEVERRVVSQLNSLMDGLKSRGNVIVIAATNRPNSIDPALRRPGRFDREIEFRVPNAKARDTILKIHTRKMPLDKSIDFSEIVERTHGYVGADLAAIAKESAMIVLRRVLPDLLKTDEKIPQETLEKLILTQKDFLDALKVVRPSAMREILIENPNVFYDSIGGLNDVKKKLKEAVEWPLKYPTIYKETGIRAPKGILLYGAPGTGKTMLAKAVATETQANFILINGPELLSKWVGESEKAVRRVFEKAREVSPSIIFFDEIDSLVPRRGRNYGDSGVTERVVNQLLTEIQGLKELEDVVIIAATNRPDLIDAALLRPGRFDRVVHIPTPDKDTRLEIFKIHTKNMKLGSDVDLEVLAMDTEEYVGADIESICIEAGINMLEEDLKNRKVSMKHFKHALKQVGPSITEDIKESYVEFERQFRKKKGKEMQDDMRSYLG